ncbi:hypothetical protein Btru_060429 [Bulinus truncatus]|nr:hypothetical protein Btru_060429 [Bulinus truncatus]
MCSGQKTTRSSSLFAHQPSQSSLTNGYWNVMVIIRKVDHKVVNMHTTTLLLVISVAMAMFLESCDCQRQPVFPCVDFQAIRWVRDVHYCDQYYICHFGQPMSMPACPTGQVWSNVALNCVPEFSRWDDCNKVIVDVDNADKSQVLQTAGYDVRGKTSLDIPPTQSRGSEFAVDVKQLPTEEAKVQRNEIQAKTVYGNSPVLQNNIVKRVDVYTKQATTVKPSEVTRPSRLWPRLQRQGQDTTTEQAEARQHVRRYTESVANTTAATATQKPFTTTIKPRLITSTRRWMTSTRAFITSSKHPQNQNFERKLSRGNIREEPSVVTSPLELKLKSLGISSEHPCLRHPGALLPHPKNCHWYYNCSLSSLDGAAPEITQDDTGDDTGSGFILLTPFRVRSAGLFVWECRFPQLFDDVTNTCREFVNVQCKSRFEPVEQCEYSARQQCNDESCVPCHDRFGRCRGRENGVYPVHEDKWTPLFVTCYLQRNIALDECIPPTPIFSPEAMDCVSLFDVPKIHGGFLPDCSHRPDGYYPDEQGRCAIFYRCALGKFRGYDECPPGSVFDPAVPSCQPFSVASRPCGEGQSPLCGGKLDGNYADPYGRCTHYFECKDGVFQQYSICDLGIFDPLTQKCVVSAELTVRPCGLQPSPCESLPTGVYPDQATGCHHFIECQRGVMLTNGTCSAGTVFSAITGRCDLPEHAPPPCGVSSTCLGKPDGRYPALSRGCSFFYECYNEEFVSLRRCTSSDGGIFFNPATGECDYPQNICPPCGYKWWGCDRTYQLS